MNPKTPELFGTETAKVSKPLPKLFRFGDFVLVGAFSSFLGIGILLLINDVQLRKPKRGMLLLLVSLLSPLVCLSTVGTIGYGIAYAVPTISEGAWAFISLLLGFGYHVLLWLGVSRLYRHEYAIRQNTTRLGRRKLALAIGCACALGMFAAFIACAKMIHSMGGLNNIVGNV